MIGFGAMLIEGVLAVIALITAARLSHTEYARMSANPIEIFAHGIGSCLTRVGLPEQHGLTFAALAVSAFVLTTLDSATRIARFCLQELFTIRRASDGVRVCLLDRYSATLICILAAGALALSGQATIIWPVFGAANQLLAALTLLTVTVWLLHLRRRALYTLIPACFMMAVTLTALVRLFMSNAAGARNALAGADAGGLPATFATQMTLACVTIVLFVLAVLLAVLAVRAFVQQRRRPGAVPSPAR
jgi:carbon starvation protein